MQIYVCVKHVPDTAATITVVDEAGYNDTACKFIINPYDEYAVEEAVQRVEKAGSGEVVVVTVGPEAAVSTMRAAMAMGAHRGIHVKIQSQFLDSTLTSLALKAAIEQDGTPNMIFTGRNAVDTEGFQTQYRLAAAMNLPVVSEVVNLDINDGQATVEREVGGGTREKMEMKLPCIIGATKGLNEPRYPKFPDIMKAKKKEIKEVEFDQLGLDTSFDQTELLKLEAVPERSSAQVMQGSVREQVIELVRILKEDDKVL
ncbi:MAG: electron transfer flavoprotein subunit beta/FixA family protein [Desulfobacterales bacterium]|nr:electron transfer flavoprotein subunit beta/FixA family protein [Desulfobacterales bacterium]